MVILSLLSSLQVVVALILPSLSYPWVWTIATLIFPSLLSLILSYFLP
jgi:hypothetical protein